MRHNTGCNHSRHRDDGHTDGHGAGLVLQDSHGRQASQGGGVDVDADVRRPDQCGLGGHQQADGKQPDVAVPAQRLEGLAAAADTGLETARASCNIGGELLGRCHGLETVPLDVDGVDQEAA